MDLEEDSHIDLKQFKGHHRKFPWTLLVKIVIVAGIIGMIFYMTNVLKDSTLNQKENIPDLEIEISD